MNQYEGMIIFPDALNEEGLDEAIGQVKTEMERFGAQVESMTRLGKRSFARPMNKQKSGYYVVFGFRLEGDQIAPLQKRFKLMPNVFRSQILKAPPCTSSAEKEEEPPEKEKENGVS